MTALIDLTGLRFGKLLIIERAENRGRRIYWRASCDCGKSHMVSSDSLKFGAKSCGCGRAKSHYIHGRGGKKLRDQTYSMFLNAKQRAKNKGLEFSITLTDIAIPDRCPVLGIQFGRGERRFADNSPSLDRVVTSLGYIPGNIRVISWRANKLKGDASLEELALIIDYMKKHGCQ